jgi:nucleotide-binding universal stress UspA family protein
MAIKNLLVAFQDDEGSRTALRFALQMGRKYGAAVTGTYVHVPFEGQQHLKLVSRWVPQDVAEMIRRAGREGAREVEASFCSVVAEHGAGVKHRWIGSEGNPTLMLARQARYFDLLITGQFEGALRHGGRALQPEEVIARAGKSVLMVPEKYEVRPFEEYAVVAWDGSRSAGRALTDAMQILETKRRLDVVTVHSQGETERLGWLGDLDIIEHLRRHGIEAKHIDLPVKGGVGETLLRYCGETRPDVLVMGAFGRGKLGTVLFGGVSNYVLEHQSVPVLMSH